MPRANGYRPRDPFTLATMVLAAFCALSTVAVAQSTSLMPSQLPQNRLVVLQRSAQDVPEALVSDVDRLLAGAVAAQVSSASLYVSPVPFEDVELAAGCTSREQDAACLQRIASSLGADWLLVRELGKERGTGRVFLTLVAHDGPQAMVTRRAVSLLDKSKHTPSQVVPMLIDRLYPTQRYEDRPLTEPRSLSPAKVVGWSSSAVGGSLLAAGITVGVLSNRDHEKYSKAETDTPAQVDRARELLDRAQQRARVANGLIIGGASAGAAGALALLWKYFKPKPDAEQRVRVGAGPYKGGVKFSLTGQFRGIQ